MAGLTEDNARYADPFGGDSPFMRWPTEINVRMLTSELRAVLGDDVRLVAALPEDDNGRTVTADEDHPYVLFLSPPTVDMDVVRQLMAAHRPDSLFGLSGSDRARAELIGKAQAGEDLTPDEMQRALRFLLLN